MREAVAFANQGSQDPHQLAFERGLARDSSVIVWSEWDRVPSLRSALPDEADLPASDDELRTLLRHFQFSVPMSHLEQAIEAHTRGDWAAANAQLRTFLESLFDNIAMFIDKDRATALATSENRRAMLAEPAIGFLAPDRGEWTADGKNYINGLFKMLHTHGSHPGLTVATDGCCIKVAFILGAYGSPRICSMPSQPRGA